MKITTTLELIDERVVKELLLDELDNDEYEKYQDSISKYALTDVEFELEADLQSGAVKLLSVEHDGLVYKPVERANKTT